MSNKDWTSYDDWLISDDELIRILSRIVWNESENKNEISWKTGIFYWVDKIILLSELKKRNVNVIKFEPWQIIIPEWKWNCDYFYLLLKWSLWIFIEDNWITDINTISVVWEIWFLGKSERTATVKSKDWCYLLPLDRHFIESLPLLEQRRIYENLGVELCRKIIAMNNNSCIKSCISQDAEMLSSPWWFAYKVREIIGDLII